MFKIEALLKNSTYNKLEELEKYRAKLPAISGSAVPNDLEARLVDYLGPDFDTGPWVVGGAPLRWYQGQSVGLSDIDVFCANQEQASRVTQQMIDIGGYQAMTTENAVTLKVPDPFVDDEQFVAKNASLPFTVPREITVQVILKKFFNNIDEVFDHFDISVCQVATDGFSFKLGQRTARDIRHKVLRFEKYRADSLKRMIKYVAYGYMPSPHTYNEVIKNMPTESVYRDWASKGEYDHAF